MVELKTKPWLPSSPAGDLLLLNANIVDVAHGRILPNSSIYISVGRIKHIQHHSTENNATTTTRAISPTAKVIDLSGHYVTPGLIDCHVHLYGPSGALTLRDIWDASPNTIAYRVTWAARAMLHRGFTTVRDAAGADTAIQAATAENLIPGPRIIISGKALSQTGGHGDFRASHEGDNMKCCSGTDPFIARVVDGVPECLAAARDELRKGAQFLKIMSGGGVATPTDPIEGCQFSGEEIRAITGAAGNQGTYVTAHAYSSRAIRHAVENGVRGIEHANLIDGETARYCTGKGVVFTPTLVCYYAMLDREGFLPEENARKSRVVLEKGLESLKILKEAGATICYGTDLIGIVHPYQLAEFSIRAKVLSNLDVLQSATTNAAKLLRMEGEIGCVQEGAFADLLVVEGNPLEDVTVLDDTKEGGNGVRAVIKEGRVVRSCVEGLEVDALYSRL